MNGLCEKHHPIPADDVCGWCGEEFCQDCLVYPFGEKRLPYCLACAVKAAGVRTEGSPRIASSRGERRSMLQRRKLLRERRGPGSGEVRPSHV